ncbi:MAG: PP-loop family protein [Deltaproteobacteria bacterium]|nr:PP-loop family protein [Deltaproteobacteria bacterium]
MSALTKLNQLEADCRAFGKLAVAFSGGLDSRFLCYTASRLGIPVRALHISGPHIPRRETEEAGTWAEKNHIPFTLLHVDPLQSPDIRANRPDRCYHCKRAAFTLLLANIQKDEQLCDGTNTSDLAGYRPGLRALAELGVMSPLARAGISKEEIRQFARATGMDRPEQKARPCLFTRYEYGLSPTVSGLAALDEAEGRVEALLSANGGAGGNTVPPFRLRLTGEGPLLHVQLPELADETTAALLSTLAACGFPSIRIETVEQISGYFDRKRNLESV